MQAFGSDLKDEDIWAIVTWLRNQKGHEAAEGSHDEREERRMEGHPERKDPK
jgi:cytochrome c oxidase cbb3-type subunit 2